jgi:predicted HicB family RNase H-like nuclease
MLTKGAFMEQEQKKDDEAIKAYVLRIKNSLYDELDCIARKRGHSVNTLITLALNDWLDRQPERSNHAQ